LLDYSLTDQCIKTAKTVGGKFAVLVVLFGIVVVGCNPAEFGIVGKKDKSKGINLAPPADNKAPTAAIEVIYEGKSVKQVPINKVVTIQPTKDTVDPDDVDKIKNCRNPGIVSAKYEISGVAMMQVFRASVKDCKALSVNRVFTATGSVPIKMTVTSNEKEEASAGMTLQVVATDDPLPQDDFFGITVHPNQVYVGEQVSFLGDCVTVLAHTIVWDFRDGIRSKGEELKHAFAKSGQYIIHSFCTTTDEVVRHAYATVVVKRRSDDDDDDDDNPDQDNPDQDNPDQNDQDNP